MNLAFCLFKYFPYGGLQRDFLRILRACKARGHTITVYTMEWQGEVEPGINLQLIPVKSWQNYTRIKLFVKKLNQQLKSLNYDLVIGFNKMPDLDIYYAADVCLRNRLRQHRSWMHRLLPRNRYYLKLESAVFARHQQPAIFLISAAEQAHFQHYYQTQNERFHLLPPGISRDRIAAVNGGQIRQKIRTQFHVPDNGRLILLVGSGFKTKGLDRALIAFASLPEKLKSESRFFIIGQDDATPFLKLAKKLNIQEQIHFLGARSDIPDLMAAADLLIHPAYHENTGTVLLEALVAGLAVLTVENCGYASYIKESNNGLVLAMPFDQQQLNEALLKILRDTDLNTWKQNALSYARDADLFSMPEKAVSLIETIGNRNSTS